jgi:hypothetical protein
MKALRTMFTNNLVLIIGIMALSLKQACAMDILDRELHPIEMKLRGALRAVIWDRSPQPNGEDLKVKGPMETTYGYSGGLSEKVLKSYATLIYTIAGADGISEDEREYIKGQLKLLCSDKQGRGISQSVIEEHLAGLYNKANAGELLKEENVKSSIEAHVRNLMEVGETSDIFKVAAKCALHDALMASRADGEFSTQERSAAKSAANELGISKEELTLLDKGCKRASLLNRYPVIITAPNFEKDVDAFYKEVNEYYTKK